MSNNNGGGMSTENDYPNEVSNDCNQDEAIMAQEREIEREIAESIPLIGSKCDLSVLQNEYASDDLIYQQKLSDLKTKYQYLRRMRPDGNCFFRAFTFAYLESLLNDKEEYFRFKEIAVKTKDDLVELGFSQFTVEDFHETFMDVLQKIENQMTVDELLSVLNDKGGCSDYIVVYMRLITSGYLQKNESFFSSFIVGERSMQDFCRQEVEPMYKESDHIHIIALTMALGVGVRIEYMDRGTSAQVNAHDFPEGQKPRIHLLYRPGHYDVLY